MKRKGFLKGIFGLKIPSRKRVLYLILHLMLISIIFKITSVMLINRSEIRQKAMEQILYVQRLSPKRGEILDRHGNLLATSTSAFRASADLSTLRYYAMDNKNSNINELTPEEIIKLENYAKDASVKLAPYLGMDSNELYGLLMYKVSEKEYGTSVNLGQRLDIGTLEPLKAIKKAEKYHWLILNDDTKRYYPNESLMAHVLGFTNGEEDGQYGVEFQFDEYLKGVPGVKVSEVDSSYEDLPHTAPEITNPVDGANVTLTLDESIQAIATNVAKEAMEEYSPKNVTIIVTKPSTGEVLAMVNVPDFNPNNPTALPDGQDIYDVWSNKAVEKPFEPGSTFKIVTMAAGLNEHIFNPDSAFFCPGYIMVDGVKIFCANHNGHGNENLQDIMMNSCNPGFIEMGLAIGPEKMNMYMSRFGLGKKTGIDLPNEGTGIIKSSDSVSNFDLATISIGQTNELTAIQIIGNLNTILNYGKVTTPHVVKEVTRKNTKGEIESLYTFKETKTEDILEDETAKIIIEQLINTVKEGGANAASIDNITVLGKTGTAEKMNYDSGAYDNFIVSFVGAAPAENPEISVYIAVDSPVGSSYSSVVAAPMGKKLIERTLKYLNNRPLN